MRSLRISQLLAVVFVLTACGPAHYEIASTLPLGHPVGVQPHVVQTGQVPVAWTQFVPKLSCGSGLPLRSIVEGPDRNMWLADPCGGLLRVTMTGHASERLFSNFTPTQIAVGEGPKFYMTQQGTGVIGVADLQGNLQQFTIPSGDTIYDGGIASDVDGNVWFAEQFHVGKMDPTGKITEFLYDQLQSSPNQYGGVTTGADGDIWVSDPAYFSKMLRIDPATGNITDLTGCGTPGPVAPVKQPSSFDIWNFCGGNTVLFSISSMDDTRAYTVEWPIAGGATVLPQAMILGPMGDAWWASVGGAIARFDPKTITVTAFLPPDQTDTPDAIALGHDGNVWAATANGKVDVYIINVIRVSPSSLKFTGVGQEQILTVSERGRQTWSAGTSNASVATVAPGNSGSQFVVTSVGDGSCTVTVRDQMGNSFPVPVVVSGLIRAER